MSALTGNSVGSSYLGLLKTTDNGVLGQQTPSVITDGAGNATPLSIAQEKVIIAKDNQRVDVNDVQTEIQGDTVIVKDATATNLLQATATSIALGNNINNLAFDATNAAFAGAVDFAGATVTGLPGGSPGLVAGAGGDSMVSSASLTTTAAIGTSNNAIALGEGAQVLGDTNFDRNGIAIGTNANAGASEQNVCIGFSANTSSANRSVAIGVSARTVSSRSVAIGNGADGLNFATVAVGDAKAEAQQSIAIGGYNTIARSNFSVAIGPESDVPTGMNEGMVMGYQRTALWAAALSVPRLALHEVANLNFADDTAAATGGVPVGGVYHNAGAMRIRIA